MEELPTDLYYYLTTYLDNLSLASLSQSSKHFYRILSAETVWKNRFDLYFSVDCIAFDSVDWKKEFIREFKLRQSWKNDSHIHEEPSIGSPVVIPSRDSCGKVTEIIEHIPNYPKYKIHLYEIKIEKRKYEADSDQSDYDDDDDRFEDHKYVVPTDKQVIFPRHLLETCHKYPKRALSGYLVFCQKHRAELANLGLSFGDILRQLGTMWKALSEEEKDPYNKEAALTKTECAYQMGIWGVVELFFNDDKHVS